MEKRDRSESERIVREGLHLKDPGTSQVQVGDSKDLQSNHQLQKGKDLTHIIASEPAEGLETQEVTQQGKESPSQDVSVQGPRENSEEHESFHQECEEFKDDEKSKQMIGINIMMLQKDESSLVIAQDSNQTKQGDPIHEECDAFVAEERDLDGNTKVQQTVDIPENIMPVLKQESIQITEQEDNDAIHQQYEESVEEQSVSKLGTNLVVKLKDEALKDDFLASIQSPTQTVEQETNKMVQQECDRIVENSLLLQEVASDSQTLTDGLARLRRLQESVSPPESKESHAPLRELNLEEKVYLALPRRACHYRLQIPPHPSLPAVPEEEVLPWTPFETFGEEFFEPLAQRILEALNPRLLTQQTEMRHYVQRIRESHIQPERVALHEEMRTRCVKLFWSLLLAGILVVALYFLIDFLDKKYDTDSSNSAYPLSDFRENLSIPRIDLEPGRLVANLDFNITSLTASTDYISTTEADLNDNITIMIADMDNNVSTLVVDLNNNVSTLKAGLDGNITFLMAGMNDNITFLKAGLDDNGTYLADGLDDNGTYLADGLDDNVTYLTDDLDDNVTYLADGLDYNVTYLRWIGL
ncbi:hypothetical protein HNY73_007626 [Argiope bruennichi]|uniref:Uncharacterized protein n=1 Tax=Argiope bruennichi TaxID=94029 RepID=A0A8T0FEG6_ARGBR|nr:hypothetical protein HNY73_007626 [Argiope bruennichi]